MRIVGFSTAMLLMALTNAVTLPAQDKMLAQAKPKEWFLPAARQHAIAARTANSKTFIVRNTGDAKATANKIAAARAKAVKAAAEAQAAMDVSYHSSATSGKDKFNSSLESTATWASYRSANTRSSKRSNGLRKARNAVVMAYFAARAKSATATSNLRTAKATADKAAKAFGVANGRFGAASTVRDTTRQRAAEAVSVKQSASSFAASTKAAGSKAVKRAKDVERRNNSAAATRLGNATSASTAAAKKAASAQVIFINTKAAQLQASKINSDALKAFTKASVAKSAAATAYVKSKTDAMNAHTRFVAGEIESYNSGNF